MSVIVRVTKNKRRFDKPTPDDEWIKDGEIPADAITGMNSHENRLSIFQVDDSDTAIRRVRAAYAATRDYVNKVDYLVLGLNEFSKLQKEYLIDVEKNLATTPDIDVNSWHMDIVELTDKKIVEFARVLIYLSEKEREQPKDVELFIREGIRKGEIIKEKMNGNLRHRLGI